MLSFQAFQRFKPFKLAAQEITTAYFLRSRFDRLGQNEVIERLEQF